VPFPQATRLIYKINDNEDTHRPTWCGNYTAASLSSTTLLQLVHYKAQLRPIIAYTTRKLSYSKDDRATHPYMGALKIFNSPEHAHTFAEIFNGLFFRPIQ